MERELLFKIERMRKSALAIEGMYNAALLRKDSHLAPYYKGKLEEANKNIASHVKLYENLYS